jgi:hypothetical protein
MHKIYLIASVALLCVLTSDSSASIVLEDFESATVPSFPSGWTVTNAVGDSWKVGGATGTIPNIIASDGSQFARSGEPNATTESDTGVVTSPAYAVTFSMLEWLSVGWSGGNSNQSDGESYFQILDSGFNQKALITTAQSDNWETASVNLLDIGLTAGSTFYFRAVDGRNESNYGWIGFDKLTLTGDELEVPNAVPEATSFLIWGLLGLTFATGSGRLRSRTRIAAGHCDAKN